MYFAVSDIHSFYSILQTTLKEKGFEKDNPSHKLIVCGDLFDRGCEAVPLVDFMKYLKKQDRLVYIRGNHEDLLEKCFDQVKRGSTIDFYHHSNGTLDTISQFCKIPEIDLLRGIYRQSDISVMYDVLDWITTTTVNYFELKDYIFVHGWIPCKSTGSILTNTDKESFLYNPQWRNACIEDWYRARWRNGMEMAEAYKIIEPGKHIVCGHWHCSWGHCYSGLTQSEFGLDANFEPYFGNGVIGIDACTAYSKKINCLKFDENGYLIS